MLRSFHYLLIFSLFAIAGATHLFAQHALCSPQQRFFQPLFDSVTVTRDQVYGSAPKYNGQVIDLLYDVYEPFGDTAALRPMVLVIHGGGFIQGSKTDGSIRPFLTAFAQRGFVVASINYRLDDQTNIATGILRPGGANNVVTAAFIRAAHDAKAALRYFYRSVIEDGNPYRIDTNAIVLAGGSAGGITAFHAIYIDREDKWLTYPGLTLSQTLQDLGGLEGNSGNPGFSQNVMALVNIAGAIGDTAWIERFDLPSVHLHGDADLIVPYGNGGYVVPGIVNIPLMGSQLVHDKMLAGGGDSRLQTWVGAGHVPWATGEAGGEAYLDTALKFTIAHTYSIVCKVPAPYEYANRLLPTPPVQALRAYPNPVAGQLTIALNATFLGQPLQVRVTDALGRVVYAAQMQATAAPNLVLELDQLPPGLYQVRVDAPAGVGLARIVRE
jgi:acetyl esterase/lipase